jgi:chromosome segregation ATPase
MSVDTYDHQMNFPTDAVYGIGCNPDTLVGWNGRESFENVIVQIATRDDEDCDADGSMEVMRLAVTPRNPRSIVPSWTSGTESEEESQSQHIDASPSSPEVNLVASRSTLMTDLSDLEHSLTDEVSSVKDWLRRVKSERDKLRRDKTSLMQQLEHERQMRESDVSRLRTEVAVMKAKGDRERDHLWGEVRCLKEQLLEHETIKDRDDTNAATNVAILQNQVDCAKAEMRSLEEALVKEKGLSAMREMNKEEEMRKIHFNQMSETIAELETKFKSDMDEMSERRNALLEEERKAHANTANKLQVVNIEKEQATKDLNAKIQEFDSMKAENEKRATDFDEKTSLANEEIKSLRAEIDLSRQAYDSAIVKVQTVTTNMEALSLQLQVKNTELVMSQKQLKEIETNHIQEYDRTKNQMKKLSELVEVMSRDRDKARMDLDDSQAQVELLAKANAEAEDVIRHLKEDAELYRVEIEALNEARKYFDVYEEESKAEIEKLKKRLDEFTGDILQSIQSNDSSQNSIESDKIGNECRQDGSGKDILSSKMLALPSLLNEVGTEKNDVDEETTPGRDTFVIGKGELTGHECDSLRADITRFKRERDALRKMVDTLLPLADGNDKVQLESMEEEILDLKAKLSKAEDAYMKLEGEKCETLASVTQERDALASQVGKFNAVLSTDQLNNTVSTGGKENEDSTAAEAEQPDILSFLKKKLETQVQQTNIVNEELWQLQSKFDAQVEENEKLSAELAALKEFLPKLPLPDEQDADGSDQHMSENAKDPHSETEFVERIRELELLLDLQVNGNDKVSSELTALTVSTGSEADANMQMSKIVEELKQEHRDEIKLLKQEHAAIKTKAKLLAKEKDNLTTAYEIEKLSNSELESSLEDIVNLFQAERTMNDEKSKEHKIIKKKFASMKKKRVPVDAAYKACRVMLDRLEGSKYGIFNNEAHEPLNERGRDATNLIEIINILTHALDGPSRSKLSLASIYELFSSDKNQVEELDFKVTCLQNKIEEMKLKVRMALLTKLPAQSVENVVSVGDASAQTTLSNEHYEDLDSLRDDYNSLQEKSNNLTRELVESTKAFEETITSYEAVIAKVKGLLSEKKKENAILKSDLEKARRPSVASLEKINADSLAIHIEEVNAYRESVDMLKKRLEEERAIKAKLNMDIDRLKADFGIIVTQFEQEITLSCEANENAILKKQKERDDAYAALSAKEKECSRLASDLEVVGKELSNFKQTIHSLHDELDQAKSDRHQLESKILEFQSRLDGGSYDQLDYNSLRADKEKVDAKNIELIAEVRELQNKLDGAMLSNNESMQLYEQLRVDCTSLRADKDQLDAKNAELKAEVRELQNKLDGAILSNNESMQLYEQLRVDCTSLRADKDQVDAKNVELIAEVQELQNKLDGVTLSNNESMQLYEQLRVDCTSLRADKDKVDKKNVELVEQIERQKQSHELILNQLECVHKVVQEFEEKNAELAAHIATLTTNNGALVEQIKERKQSHYLIEIQLESARKEVKAAEEDQIKAAGKVADLENHIKSLHKEVKLANEAKEKASNAADASKDQLMEATKRLDDMLVRVQVLKADHEERELSLRSSADSQMKNMNEVIISLQGQVKAIESEKEINETMYKNDISLQQEVSLFLMYITAL